MTSIASGLPDRLREETRPHHDAAERHPLQAALARGTLPLETYVAHLEQLLLIHARLESWLLSESSREPRLLSVADPAHFQEANLRADLRHFGGAESPSPTPATRRLLDHIDQVAASCPIGLLGFHYVLEGSKNGGRFIAIAVRRAYHLEGAGTAYLDPHGEQQRPLWQAHRQRLGAIAVTPAEADVIIDSAKALFVAIAATGDDLLAAGEAATSR
ncbi:MAG: biliverdin-producing heme oxygenase [Candidatus Sumerlaeia bacterium]|nr:biliverdin-producing heme oxygenase [Candidatus Sumerlaeia bacterium]